jgi:hypothetical protein
MRSYDATLQMATRAIEDFNTEPRPTLEYVLAALDRVE